MSLFSLMETVVAAGSGLYMGGSVGSAIIQDSVPTGLQVQEVDFKSNDTGYRLFAGIRLDSLAIESGYINFGNPDDSNNLGRLQLDLDGFDLSAILNFELGPIDIFGRGGLFFWESETQIQTVQFTDDGADIVLGAGVGFRLGSLGIRGEVEWFDVGDVNDVYFVSIGAVLMF
jgi:hypothetical protein